MREREREIFMEIFINQGASRIEVFKLIFALFLLNLGDRSLVQQGTGTQIRFVMRPGGACRLYNCKSKKKVVFVLERVCSYCAGV